MNNHSSIPSPHKTGPRFVFGIYPGSGTGTGSGAVQGSADDPVHIQEALALLQPEQRPFVIRGYVLYAGASQTTAVTPDNVIQYLVDGRQLDLALCYRDPEGDVKAWTSFVRECVRHYGPHLTSLQIGEEANTAGPGGNGGFPNVRQAVVKGVLAAKDEVQRLGCEAAIGINATLIFNPSDDFWPSLAVLGQQPFVDALDYVGLDFFPDVYRPILPAGSLTALCDAVVAVLKHFRTVNLASGNIAPSVPIHITENGWPTSPTRSDEQQAAVLETIIRTLYEHRTELNITHYELFDLRDADSSTPEFGYQFGLLRDDYTPKPAFERFRQLIAELG